MDSLTWVSGITNAVAGMDIYNGDIYASVFRNPGYIFKVNTATAAVTLNWSGTLNNPTSVSVAYPYLYTSIASNGAITQINLSTGAIIKAAWVIGGYGGGGLVYTFGGTYLYAVGPDANPNPIQIMELSTGNVVNTLWFRNAAYSPFTGMTHYNGYLYVSVYPSTILRMDPNTAAFTVFATGLNSVGGLIAFGSYLYVINGGYNTITQVLLSTGQIVNASWLTGLNTPNSLATDGNYLYIGNQNGTISQFSLGAPPITIGTGPTGIKYKSGTNFIDICNNFVSKFFVENPTFNGQNFSTGIFCYYNSSKYDLAQLYTLNTTIVQIPAINTNIFTRYNSSLYDINSFLNPNASIPPTSGLFGTLATTSSNWKACYSLKLLVGNYTGFIINIRRASDNNTMSFYSTDTGVLTSQPNGTGTAIASFLSATTGYVTTWYDQSGKNNHATQTNTAFQPIIDLTNNCLDFGYSNNQNLYFNIPNGTVPVGVLNASYSFVVKHGNTINNSGGFIGAGSGGVGNQVNSWRFFGNTRTYRNYWWGNDFDFGNGDTTIPIVAAVTYNGSTFAHKGYRAAALVSTTSRQGGTTSNAAQSIGRTVVNEYLKGQMYALLIFSAELSQSDVTILNTL